MAEQKLPKAIQAQIDAAEALEKQLAEGAASEDGNTETAQPETQTEVEQPVAVEKEPAQAQPHVEDDGYKRKYDTLAGKYNAEVPRLHEQVRSQAEALRAMKDELENLRKSAVPEKPKAALVTSKDEETFGADLIDVTRRVAKDEVSEVLARLSQIEKAIAQVSKVPEKIHELETRQVQSEEEKFWGSINEKIPDWQQVDSNPEWIDFLATKAPFSVKTYRELALEAIGAYDVSAIVELVDHWKDKSGIKQREDAKNQRQQELQSQAQPNNKKASSVPADTKGRIWTAKEYENAFDPRLTRTMSDADVNALQAEAERAYVENRVRW